MIVALVIQAIIAAGIFFGLGQTLPESALWTRVMTAAAPFLLFPALLLWKGVAVLPNMHTETLASRDGLAARVAELEAENDRLRVAADDAAVILAKAELAKQERLTEKKRADLAQAEGSRRGDLMRRLVQLYINSHDGISSELLSGLALPPKDWLNEKLAEFGESWQISEIFGTSYQTLEFLSKRR